MEGCCEGEAHFSCLAHAPFDRVWGQVARFDAIGELLAEELECCVIENGLEADQVGAIRRQVYRFDRDRVLQAPVLRERLDAYFDSPLKRFYTYRLMPPEPPFTGRSPMPCAVSDLAVTLTVSPVTQLDKCYMELYGTFRADSPEQSASLTAWLERHFRAQLGQVCRRFPAHACEDALPEALVRFSADSRLEQYHPDLEKAIAMWRAAVAAERNMLAKVATLRQDLHDSQRVLEASIAQHRDEMQELSERLAKAEHLRDALQRRLDGAAPPADGFSPAAPSAGQGAGPPVAGADAVDTAEQYYSPQPQAEGEAPPHSPPEQQQQDAHAGEAVRGDDEPPAGAGGDNGSPFAKRASTVGVCITEQQIRRKFQQLDTNGNGWLSRDELRRFYISNDNYGIFEDDDVVERHLSRYLRDGKVTLPEFSMLMLKLAQR
eukprot:TRINITY_DN11208_c0_g1_i1.p1 TRINITY_DN11208_c0_g1~~TRINITY_DN11208_c0_g1_i1.p1  ORF type:complete len:462 (+),score=177.22 TRINITY_DN11208_c0_g1_i1:89-1387(+)